MIRTAIVFVLCFSTLSSIMGQSIDKSMSMVNFEIPNMKFSSCTGNFTGMEGEVVFNVEDLSSSRFNVCLDAASVNTENTKRDDHLRNADFFDVEKFPTICFKSTAIEQSGNAYQVKGTLTMHGVTKQVTIPFQVNGKTLKGKISVNRQDYGVGPEGTFMVGADAELEIVCVLN